MSVLIVVVAAIIILRSVIPHVPTVADITATAAAMESAIVVVVVVDLPHSAEMTKYKPVGQTEIVRAVLA